LGAILSSMELHELIRAGRAEYELTQPELAERAGVSTRQVRRWEAGANLPRASRIAPIADALHLSPGTLSELCNAPSDVRAHRRGVRSALRENGPLGTETSMIRFRIAWGIEVHELRPGDLADAVGASPRTVRRWLAGEREPGWAAQCAIAEFLDLPIWWLHTDYSDGCDLLGWSADDVTTDRAEAFRLRESMRSPYGWSFTQTTVDEDLVTNISTAHGLPADDVRRVAYPLTCSPGSRTPLTRQYPAAIAMTRALQDNTAGIPLSPQLRLQSIAAILDVDATTIKAWAAGTTEMKPATAARVAIALAMRSWSLWLPRSDGLVGAGR